MLEFYDQITKLKNILEKFASYIIFVSTEKDVDDLMWESINIAMELTKSDGATIYMKEVNDGEEKLIIKATKNQSVNFSFYLGYTLPLNSISLAGYVAKIGNPVVINNIASLPENHQYKQFKFFDRSLHYTTVNTITIPMVNFSNEVIGVFQVINKKVKPELVLDEKNTELYTIDYNESDVNMVLAIAALLSLCIDRINLYRKKEETILTTQKLISTIFDSLKSSVNNINNLILSGQEKFIQQLKLDMKSKILNYQQGLELCEKQIQLSKATDTILSMAYFVLDKDSQIINLFEQVFSEQIRAYDILFQIEDSVYAVLFYNVDLTKARMIAKRIKKIFAERLNQVLSNADLLINVGFSEIRPSDTLTINELINNAKAHLEEI